MEKPTLVVILGPTGVGKTNISLRLAEELACAIVSSDSRQLYRELVIGTAAPTMSELSRAPHYFIGTHSIFDEYSAGQYEIDAVELLEKKLFVDNDKALLVGGSMMYIDAVCNGMDDVPSIKPEIRSFWMQEYQAKGLGFLQKELQKLDPEHYAKVDLKNYKRVLHAIEVCVQTGRPYSEFRTGAKKERSFNILKVGLNRPRPELYERINARVDAMMAEGLLQEARQFYEYRHLNTLNTVGYKELYEYMSGNCTLEFAVEKIKQDSRNYAKRQLTWFNRDAEINWFHPEEENDIIAFVKGKIFSNS